MCVAVRSYHSGARHTDIRAALRWLVIARPAPAVEVVPLLAGPNRPIAAGQPTFRLNARAMLGAVHAAARHRPWPKLLSRPDNE